MPYTLIQANYGAMVIVFHINIFVNCILLSERLYLYLCTVCDW